MGVLFATQKLQRKSCLNDESSWGVAAPKGTGTLPTRDGGSNTGGQRPHNLVPIGQPLLLQSLALTVNEETRSRVTYSVILPRLGPDAT